MSRSICDKKMYCSHYHHNFIHTMFYAWVSQATNTQLAHKWEECRSVLMLTQKPQLVRETILPWSRNDPQHCIDVVVCRHSASFSLLKALPHNITGDAAEHVRSGEACVVLWNTSGSLHKSLHDVCLRFKLCGLPPSSVVHLDVCVHSWRALRKRMAFSFCTPDLSIFEAVFLYLSSVHDQNHAILVRCLPRHIHKDLAWSDPNHLIEPSPRLKFRSSVQCLISQNNATAAKR